MRYDFEKGVGDLYKNLHLSKWSNAIVLTLLLTTVWFAIQIPKIKFDYNVEAFFSNEDPEVAIYEEFKKEFGDENNILLIGIDSESGVFNERFLTQVDTLTRALKKLELVTKVISPTNLKEYVIAPLGGLVPISMIHLDKPALYGKDSLNLYTTETYIGSIFSKNKPCIALAVMIKEGLIHAQNEILLEQMKKILADPFFEITDYHLAGRIQTQHFYISAMKREMLLFSSMAFFLFCTSVFLIFRKLCYVAIPLSVVIISLIWVFGVISLLGISLDLMLTIFPTLVIILGTSVCVHFLSKFRVLYKHTDQKAVAIKQAFIETTTPNALISLTTAIGLASLYMVPVVSIQRFGLLSALAVVLVLVLGLVLIPHMLHFFQIVPTRVTKRSKMLNQIPKSIIWFLFNSRKRKVIGIYLILVSICLIGISRMHVNNYFLDDIEESTEIKQDLIHFEKEFSGIRPFELMIKSKDSTKTLLSYENIQLLERIEKYVKEHYNLGMLQSPLQVLRAFNKSLHGGRTDHYIIPNDIHEFDVLIQKAKRKHVFKRTNFLLNEKQNTARISGRLADTGGAYYTEKNKLFSDYMNTIPAQIETRLTGVAYLIDNANINITKHFLTGLILVIIIVTLIISYYSFSFKMGIVALLVNLIPLLVTGAIMGYLGFPLKISTALVFTIVFGISVDDTIHFLHRYLTLLEKYKARTSIKLTLMEMTQPILYTTVILFSGFMIFSLSSFEGAKILGSMTSIALIAAMVTDLILLPVLLLSFHKKSSNRIAG